MEETITTECLSDRLTDIAVQRLRGFKAVGWSDERFEELRLLIQDAYKAATFDDELKESWDHLL